MKSIKGILGLIAAGALVLSVSSARALTVSDYLQAFASAANGGTQLGSVQAFEGAESNTTLYSFNHNYSDPLKLGQYYAIIDPVTGLVSDVVGVASVNGTFAAGTNVFGFMSDDETAGGLTAAQIALYFNQNVGNFVEGPNGILLDVSFFINQANAASAGGNAQFFSDAPDGGTTVSLLGLGLMGVAILRRKFQKTA